MSDVPKNRVFMTPFNSASEAYEIVAARFIRGLSPRTDEPVTALADEYKFRFALEHIRIICEMSDAEDSSYEM